MVNIGTRQNGRIRANNVIDVSPNFHDICKALDFQIKNGKYESYKTYGDGKAGKRIANILAESKDFQIQKRIAY